MASCSERYLDEDLAVQRDEYDSLRNAFQQDKIDTAMAIVKAGNVKLTPLALGYLVEAIKAYEDGLRQELIASFTRFTTNDHICSFIEMALKGSDVEERQATIIAEHYPELLIRSSGGDSLINLAASEGKMWIIGKCLKFFRRDGHQDVLSDQIGSSKWTMPRTTLESAARGGHLKVVQMLVDFDNELLEHGYPLNAAVKGGHLDVVEFLLTTKPELVTHVPPAANGYSALFEERNEKVAKEVSAAINELLIAQIVRVKGQFESPAVIKKLLTGPQGTSSSNKRTVQRSDC